MKRTLAATAALVTFMVAGSSQARRWPVPPAWFRHDVACIRLHESTNGRGSPNLYGMLDGWAQAGGRGWAGDASWGEQLYRTWLLYRWSLRRFGDGWLPWTTAAVCGLR